jgi:lipoprotein
MAKFKYVFRMLFSLLLACMMIAIFSCKGTNDVVDESQKGGIDLERESNIRKIKIKVTADSNITVSTPNTFEAEESSAWAVVKSNAFSLVKAKEGYRLKAQWKRDGIGGQPLNDTDVFLNDITVYAESEKLPEANERVEITIKTKDKNIELIDTEPIIAKKSVTKWSDIQDEAKAKLKFSDGFELHSFRHGSETGAIVLNDDTFSNNNEEVFAVAKQKRQTPGGSETNPPSSSKEQYNVTFSLLKGRDLNNLSDFSIKAKKLPDGEEKTSAFVANKGDKIQFTVTLKDATNVEEWKVNGTSLEYGTASFTVIVDGITNVTAMVDMSQFKAGSDTIFNGTLFKNPKTGNKEARTLANGTLVIPSTIGSNAIKEVVNIGDLSFPSNIIHVYIADGIESITAKSLFGYYSTEFGFSKIESIRLPNTLKTIGSNVFSSMPRLIRYLLIPKSVKKIGDNVVYKDCNDHDNVKGIGLSIYFEHEGTQIDTLDFDQYWCAGLFRANSVFSPLRVYVKEEKLKDKLTSLQCKAQYNISVQNFTSIPLPNDKLNDRWW